MPTARFCHTQVVDGKIYAIGGVAASAMKRVEAYDPATDTWAAKADMPTARTFKGTSAVDGQIYVIGGESYWGGPTLATVEAYDPVTDTWTRKADMPAPRAELAASAVNGKIYAIGGHSVVEREVSTVEMYDPATDTWTRKSDMPTARAFPSTAVLDGQIYVIGGQLPGNGRPQSTLSTVEVYDPVTDTWTRRADLPSPNGGMGTGVLNGKIYSFGGKATKLGGGISTVFEYDPVTDIWTVTGDMPVPNHDMGASTVDGRIYLIGGSSVPAPYTEVLSTVWEYDIGLRAASPDFNGDGVVDDTDATIMVNYWHTDEPLCDLAPQPWGDGIVDVQDMEALIQHLGQYSDDPTLIAHWALDEAEGDAALDSVSENGYSDGYVLGDPVWLPDGGQVNGAIQLDGVDDFIITSPVLNPADGPFSILAWIKGGAAAQVIMSEPSGSNWLSADPLEGYLMTEPAGAGRSFAPLLSETVITDGSWHRIGLVWDGLNRTLYVDGVVAAQDTQDGLQSAGTGMYFGTGSTMAPGTFFSGLIDDVRIYNRAVKP